MESEGKIAELEGVGWGGEFKEWPPIEKLEPENSPYELIENSSNSSPSSAAPRKIGRLTAVQKAWLLILLLTITAALLQLVLYLNK
jgi:hypothetical protein